MSIGRKRIFLGISGAIVVVGLLISVGHWHYYGRFIEKTDDAYLQADNTVISTKVPGYITRLNVGDNQRVRTGDPLAQIDDRQYRNAVAQGQAEVASALSAVGDIEAKTAVQRATERQSQARVGAVRAELEFAQREFDRYGSLTKTGAVSLQQLQRAESDLKRASAALSQSEAEVDIASRQLDVLTNERQMAAAGLDKAKAVLERAGIDLADTVIRAPTDGVVGDRGVRLGQYTEQGTRLMTIVPTSRVYVIANFKETQVGDLQPGEHVSVRVDAYPDMEVTGIVDSLSPGTGAQFAMLPPQNSTGNFVRITQRVPVKIRLEADAGVPELRAGMSARVSVDTRMPSLANRVTDTGFGVREP